MCNVSKDTTSTHKYTGYVDFVQNTLLKKFQFIECCVSLTSLPSLFWLPWIYIKKSGLRKKTELCRVINSLMKRLCYLYFFYFCFDNILLRQYSVIRKAKSLWGWKLERNCCLIQRVLKCYCTGLDSRH